MLTRILIVFSVMALSFAPAPVSASAADKKPAAGKSAPKAKKVEKEKTAEELREEAFGRGKRAYDRGDWLKAIANLRPLAEYGDARAMLLLGNMYAAGTGVTKDTKEAFALYHRAAVANSTDGMVAIAAMYQTGLGIGVNTRLAIGWFERAARLGSQPGAFFYGIHKFQGSKGTTYDLKADHEEAYKWFRLAARGDDRKLRLAAYQTAKKLEGELPPDRVIEIDKQVKDWARDTLEVLGPNPEEIYIQEMREKGKIIEPGNMPEEKPDVTPDDDKDGGKEAGDEDRLTP